MEAVRRRLRISGRVQGVGFRDFVQRTADALGVRGWVRNLPDGTVACEAQAAPAAMEQFVEAVRAGPRFARVSELEVEDLPNLLEPFEGFRIR